MWKHFLVDLLFITHINLSIGAHIRVCNQGVYLAKCYPQSKTFSYGFQLRKYDTELFPIFPCTTLDVPLDSYWNYLECKALTCIAIYSTIFTQELSTSFLNTCYTITGTIFNPAWS
ncbi:unnamed protein product [Rotaria magnacalcarata]|uniref:Uncharacterized protein n=1 Tax=Rotaria magnacalcarata TaxID=392030 RepID=A0A818XRH3_9BILA|nr:unnamed protein product [Rotaria magnacalcarata]CAF2112889.1 unnamed protein product [Rotaria magnacalcarata]CAF3743903.1 unnamed protein product [Rotaria magnacalcarata]CAF3744548.1 unnamed protein product [Rotaria magnacalcarata]